MTTYSRKLLPELVRPDLVVGGIKNQALAFVHGERERKWKSSQSSGAEVSRWLLGCPGAPRNVSVRPACSCFPPIPNPGDSQCSAAFLRWRLQKQALPRNLLIVDKGQAEALPAALHGGPERYLELLQT